MEFEQCHKGQKNQYSTKIQIEKQKETTQTFRAGSWSYVSIVKFFG